MATPPKFCQTSQEFDAWDDFILHYPGAYYCQLFGWLSSYASMGFDCEVMVQTEGGAIIGRRRLFSHSKSHSCPVASLFFHMGQSAESQELASWQALMEALDNHFQRRGTIYVQIWPPVAKEDLTGLGCFVGAEYHGPGLFKSNRFS